MALVLVTLLLVVGASEGKSDSRSVVQASEIQAAIERGEPIEYDDKIIEGDLDLSYRALETVHFNNTVFRGSVNFQGTNFTGSVWFIGANFSGDADFSWAEFSGTARQMRGSEFPPHRPIFSCCALCMRLGD